MAGASKSTDTGAVSPARCSDSFAESSGSSGASLYLSNDVAAQREEQQALLHVDHQNFATRRTPADTTLAGRVYRPGMRSPDW